MSRKDMVVNKQEDYVTKQKKRKIKRAFFLAFAVVFGIAAGAGGYYLINTDNNTDVYLHRISGPEKLEKKGDQIVYEVKVKNPKGKTIWKEPDPVHGVSFEYSNNGEHNLMVVTALIDIQFEASIHINVTNNKVTASKIIQSYYGHFTPIPITSEYFKFQTTDAVDDTIVGFSNAVVADPSIIVNSKYDSMDFTINPNIKYVSADASFSQSVFSEWKIKKMSFSGLQFRFRQISASAIASGFEMFAKYNFPSLVELDLSYADFASTIARNFPNKNTNLDIHTGYKMFEDCYFPNLYTLKINDAIFASTGMQKPSSSDTQLARIYTASSMFSTINNYQLNMFKSLTILDLSNAIFAADQMGCGDIFTANKMFASTKMNNLDLLKMSNTIFAAQEMSKYTGSTGFNFIRTSNETFNGTQLNSLNNLDLSSVVFSTTNMVDSTNTRAQIDTGYLAFSGSILSNLESLDLSNTEFASEDNYNTLFRSGSATFHGADLSSVMSINLDDTKFAAENMARGSASSRVDSASQFFEQANLSSLKTLDLSKTIFCVENTTSGELFTATSMFYYTNLGSLESIDLSTNILQCNNMSGSTSYPMRLMFSSARALKVKDIYLPSDVNNSIVYKYDETFTNWNGFSSTGTIHWEDYVSVSNPYPANWTSSWFNTWTWTNT
ncbi:MAG: hypothetical protein Ta2E_07390 [Mycoplasmoidaceae bacterium]|nr:MAG: hypothetical protein Ta2E_07390 [Mycoplasmoidaceae bacterium]